MLVTTCPECDTTFRISVGILEKAGGQVRCGRCAHVFDANRALRDIDDPASTANYSTEFRFHLYPDTDSEIEPEAELEAETDSGLQADTAYEEADPADDIPGPETPSPPVSAWVPGADRPADSRSSAWAIGAVVLSLALAGQLAHRYRSSLVAVPGVGPALESVYARFGQDVRPAVDLDQYDLFDLTAVAEPSGEEQGWLMIETRVRNDGPRVQPYPHIFVRVLDRWQETIAGRYFAPEEYMVTPVSDGARMNAGSTVDVQFIIMDPGPSATGFELELCARTNSGFQCESDVEQ